MDDAFEKLPAHPEFNNTNLRPYEDGKIIKRIPKFKDTDNIYKQMHPQNEFSFALRIIEAQQQLEQCNPQNAENVVKIHSAIETDNYYYLLMDRCENSIYSEIRKFNSRIEKGNQQQIIDIVYQIFKGYRFLQSINQNFIHRDLALDNLLFKIVDGRIIVKIADFGISKTDYAIQTSNINQKSKFLAPEFRDFTYKKKEQGKYSNQVDIYSLGICLYIMMYGLTDVIEFTDRGILDIQNREQNKLVNLIIDMTKQNQENRINWDTLYQRIVHDHVIFHSSQYYELEKHHQDTSVIYDKQDFLKYAMLIIDKYKTEQDGVQVYKPFIRDTKIYLQQFQRVDHFIQMINQAHENETYILIQVLLVESQRNFQEYIQETASGNFQNLEFLQIKQYLRTIIQKASEKLKIDLTQQQSYQIIQEIRRRSANPDYYNYYINEQLSDVSERTCCLVM